MTTPYFSRRSLLGLAGAGAGAIILSGCGGDDDNSGGGGKSGNATINWWHISNTDPGLTVYANIAKAYESAHPGVKINITPLENEAFKAKLTTVTQAGNPPDIFHSWGGGVLENQVSAGLVKEFPADAQSWLSTINKHGLEAYQVNGKQYGVPFDLGAVGFWYNKELFEKAKVTEIPKTWSEFLDVVQKIKAAGITPIALAGAEKWPAHFYWSYLAIRYAGVDGLEKAAKDGSFDTDDFVKAGEAFKKLIDLQPFQKGFLGAKYSANDGQAGIMGNGLAAMELMGQWAGPTEAAYSTSKEGIGDKLGFFPFPGLDPGENGKGSPDDVFGGGNGMAVGKNAPDEAFEYVKYFLSVDNQKKLVTEAGGVIPVVQGAETALTDENLKMVQQLVAKAPKFQMYLDQKYPPALGTQVNDSVAELVAGKASPEKVAQDIAKTAKTL
ncbi:MAG: extracellular solute-binding protein [Micromonosporaceae bacterium]|jgi:raffinose/stachyose/melibiose transport system substrate-binding protein|nr:extracellular solute-binding protein [Micromonosporaceae bacterium]